MRDLSLLAVPKADVSSGQIHCVMRILSLRCGEIPDFDPNLESLTFVDFQDECPRKNGDIGQLELLVRATIARTEELVGHGHRIGGD